MFGRHHSLSCLQIKGAFCPGLDDVHCLRLASGPTFKDFTEKHGPLLAELIRAEEPIVVVADFASGAGLLQAPKMKVPLVINVPMPASLLKTVLLLTNPFISAFARRWHHGDRFAIEYLSDIGMPAVQSTTSIVNSSPAVDKQNGKQRTFLRS